MQYKTKWGIGCLALLIVFMMAAAGCGAGSGTTQAIPKNAAAQALTVQVLDVGQGDAILVRTAEQVVLIDTGDIGTREKLVSYIKKMGISVIDKVIITHAHADHLGGMAAVFDNFTVKQIYDSGFAATTNTYRQYLLTAQKKKIPFAVLQSGSQVELGDGVVLKILAPEKPYITGTDSDVNNNSIVAKLVYNQFSMLLTGDAQAESEERMVKRYGSELKCQVLKSPHHGSRTSSTAAFLKAAAPEAVVISLSANNDYQHPHPSVMKRYQNAKLKIYRTDQNGTVTITSDGKSYQIVKEK